MIILILAVHSLYVCVCVCVCQLFTDLSYAVFKYYCIIVLCDTNILFIYLQDIRLIL